MPEQIARQELEAVAEKLNQFAAGLTESEQHALSWLLAHAQPQSDEVTGFLGTLSGSPAQVTVRPPQPGTGGQQQGIIAILIG
jgi:hypothetical protein